MALGLIAVAVLVPGSHGDTARRFDVAGIVLSATGLVALTYGIIEAGERGRGDPRALVTIAAGVLALGALVLRQRRAAAPLIDLDLFRNRTFTGGILPQHDPHRYAASRPRAVGHRGAALGGAAGSRRAALTAAARATDDSPPPSGPCTIGCPMPSRRPDDLWANCHGKCGKQVFCGFTVSV